MATEDIKWYRCVVTPEGDSKGVSEAEINAFISYTFGEKKTRNLHYYTPRHSSTYSWSIDEEDWMSDRYEFTPNRVYKVVGKYIIDDNRASHEFAKIADCFAELHYTFDDDVKTLIKRKEEKGDRIDITPVEVNERSFEILYSITCCVCKGRKYMSSTRRSINIFEAITECYKTLRDSSPRIPHEIKRVLEDKMRKTKR